MRDILTHHYADINAEAVFNTCKEKIPQLRDNLQKIQNAIDTLQNKYKEALILRDINGMSYKEIAEIINVPVGTVKSRVNRARIKLQKKLRNHSPEDEIFNR